ncbi:hypothetical protein BDN72DRAFT_844240 [Pluteus cervinus]|uniref:Uncharacterized protein n=1 Tax=Pluteus cervinus TaxID=181527 RepID=A0ACD3ALA7_9AGAR|nr:hypothetical protein BDN72DRAFT_844240 [Pluteus cervinus]
MDFPVPIAEDLAIALGIAQGESAFILKPHVVENDRITNVNAFVSRLAHLPKPEQDAILSEFSAKYLPAMMDRWATDLLPTTGFPREYFVLVNGYFWAVRIIYRLPYFGKFLMSKEPIAAPGKHFVTSLGARLTLFGLFHLPLPTEPPLQEGIEDFYLHPVFLAVTMLATILCMSSKRIERGKRVDISNEVLNSLLSLLDAWRNQRGHQDLADASNQLHWLLSSRSDDTRQCSRAMRKFYDNSSQCGLPGCEETENLKACARCLTVYYCCPEHQRAHWNSKESPPHKPVCFQTAY